MCFKYKCNSIGIFLNYFIGTSKKPSNILPYNKYSTNIIVEKDNVKNQFIL